MYVFSIFLQQIINFELKKVCKNWTILEMIPISSDVIDSHLQEQIRIISI